MDASTGNVIYDYAVSGVDFSSNNFQDVLITKMANTPSNMVGYTIIQGEQKAMNSIKYSTFYFGKNNKPSSAPNTTSFITSGIQIQDGNA